MSGKFSFIASFHRSQLNQITTLIQPVKFSSQWITQIQNVLQMVSINDQRIQAITLRCNSLPKAHRKTILETHKRNTESH